MGITLGLSPLWHQGQIDLSSSWLQHITLAVKSVTTTKYGTLKNAGQSLDFQIDTACMWLAIVGWQEVWLWIFPHKYFTQCKDSRCRLIDNSEKFSSVVNVLALLWMRIGSGNPEQECQRMYFQPHSECCFKRSAQPRNWNCVQELHYHVK